MKNGIAIVIFALAAATAHGADPDSFWEEAYPAAAKGEVRFVLQLPKEKNEGALQVEIIAGKNLETDGVNQYSLSGKIEEQIVEGWGYTRYNVVTNGEVQSTLIGGSRKPVMKFVTLASGSRLVGYNSKLPVVVYAPEGVEVRYRIWKAEPEVKAMDKG